MSSTVKRFIQLIIFGASAFILFACSVPGPPPVSKAQLDQYLSNKPQRLHPYYAKVIKEGRHNLVLNQLRAGLAAIEAGEWPLAEQSFDQALLGIEAIYANNETAAKARSLWYDEEIKDYKGEPYERAMAYYYRGLLYMRNGDYENARACFKSGILQDAFAEEEQERCDFALLIFLVGWTSQKLGDTDLATKAYQELKLLRPDFQPPDTSHDALILVETGKSPRKVADGVGHAELKYRRGKKFTENRAAIKLEGKEVELYPMEDIFRQANTRGGRPIEKILDGKVLFMKRAMDVGSVLTKAGTIATLASTMANSNAGALSYIGGALTVAGGVSTIVGINVKTHADVRYWDNLPDAIHVGTFKQGEKKNPLYATFADQNGQKVAIPPKTISVTTDRDGHGLGWTRSQTAFVQLEGS